MKTRTSHGRRGGPAPGKGQWQRLRAVVGPVLVERKHRGGAARVFVAVHLEEGVAEEVLRGPTGKCAHAKREGRASAGANAGANADRQAGRQRRQRRGKRWYAPRETETEAETETD